MMANISGVIDIGHPAYLADARVYSESKLFCLVYSTQKKSPAADAVDEKIKAEKLEFHYKCLVTDLTSLNASDQPTRLLFKSCLESVSQSGPMYLHLEEDSMSYVLGCDTTVRLSSIEIEPPASVQQVPNLDNPPYIWNQTEEDITILVTLDQPVRANQVHCIFTSKTVHLSIKEPEHIPIFKSLFLFDDIIVNESMWTIEGDCLLTLYLQKKNSVVRWPQLFRDDDGVLETVDPNTIAEIREKLDKFTGPEEAGKVNIAQAHPLSERAEAEDLEIDSAAFNRVAFKEGLETLEVLKAPCHQWICTNLQGNPTVCLAHDVDALIFSVKQISNELEHIATIPAFNFVKNSKTSRKFTGHSDQGDISFVIEGQRNAYFYRVKGKEEYGEQVIVDLTRDIEIQDPQASNLGFASMGSSVAILRNNCLVIVNFA